MSDTKWLKLVEAEAELKGNTKKWVYCSRRDDFEAPVATPDAVVIVPFVKHPQGTRLLLIREYRMPINQTIIALPAGLVDPGETAESTAERELLEETGYVVTAILDTSPPTLFPSAGLTDECFQFVFVEAEYRGPAAPEASEEIELIAVTIEGLRTIWLSHPRSAAAHGRFVINIYKRVDFRFKQSEYSSGRLKTLKPSISSSRKQISVNR